MLLIGGFRAPRVGIIVLLLANLLFLSVSPSAFTAPASQGEPLSFGQGLAPSGAPLWHLAGLRGQGVRVGIIDEGFGGYCALLGTALPAQVVGRSFVPGDDQGDLNAGSPHGAAVAEIVHAMAPEAELYLAKIASPEELPQAVAWLVEEAGVQVIHSSPRWYGLTPGDGTGALAELVAAARAQGVVWVAPAGDARLLHWGGTWTDENRDGRLDFAYEQDDLLLILDGQTQLPPNLSIRAWMRWSDWEQADQDLDFCLYRAESANEVAWGDAEQTGLSAHTPTERLAGQTWGAASAYALHVYHLSGERPSHIDIFVSGVSALSNPVPSQSLAELADAPAAIVVSAVAVRPPYAQAPYSSEGPSKGPGGVAEGGAPKPDLAAYTGVGTLSQGLLEGTAAAAAHVTGAVALVRSAFPAWDPDGVQAWLVERAIDLGAPGWDPLYGHGRLSLGAPPLPPPAQRWLPIGQR